MTTFSTNITTLLPLVNCNNHPNQLLTASPWSAAIYPRESFWGGMHLIAWCAFEDGEAQSSDNHLKESLRSTMEFFFNTLSETLKTQDLYLKELKDICNVVHDHPTYLLEHRVKLKQAFEHILPFAKALNKSHSVFSHELITILAEEQLRQNDPTKIFNHDSLSLLNNKISALIHLDCIFAGPLPYNEMMNVCANPLPATLEILKNLSTQVFSKTDFKITFRALQLLFQIKEWNPDNISRYFIHFANHEIELIKYPDYKLDRWRRQLTSGDVVNLSPEEFVVLGECISPPKSPLDGRIIYRIQNDPDNVIIFYPNKVYHSYLETRANTSSWGIKTVKPTRVDPKMRWSIQPYYEKAPLPHHRLVDLMDWLLKQDPEGPRAPIDFDEIVLDANGKEMSLVPIYQKDYDFEHLIESLITYYNKGYYNEEYPLIYDFLLDTIQSIKTQERDFFLNICRNLLDLGLDPEPHLVNRVIDEAWGSSIWKNRTSMRVKCQYLADQINTLQNNMIQQVRTSGAHTPNLESDLIESIKCTFPNMVCLWIMPNEVTID